MQFFTLAISALAAASAVVAAPLEKRAGGQGQATYYYQNGNPGSCGQYNSDSRPIVAVNSAQMNSGLCGQSIWIKGNGKTIEATIADTCPTCDYGSLDLSTGAFDQLSSREAGEIPITWWT
ncbi:Expansin [Pseudozyma hubeiensis]|nr:Expansin [Pseudozyma hubeiensis]